jgi:hypothetical protein
MTLYELTKRDGEQFEALLVMTIEAYFYAGMVLGWFIGCLTFVAAYIYCANAYGIPVGLGLGWLPSGILAVAVGWFAMVVWPVLVVLILVLVLILIAIIFFAAH